MHIHITFGLQLDKATPIPDTQIEGGIYYTGPKGLISLLETYLGLAGTPADLEYLRIEKYRQALSQHLEKEPTAFFARSFLADQFGTAQDLLSRRDELLMAGWDFQIREGCPPRIRTLSEIEQHYDPSYAGYADRFELVLNSLPELHHPIKSIHLCEPLDLLPYSLQRLFRSLETSGIELHSMPEPLIPEQARTDLERFQMGLFNRSGPFELEGDGSLLLIKGKDDALLAGYLAKLLAGNPDFKPSILIRESSRLLEAAFAQEGLPGMGLESTSLARPVLQILKLAPAFLWTPINPYKMLEFVNLALKPLDDDLANAIGAELAASPGLDSEQWRRSIARAFERIEKKYPNDPKRLAAARDQYQFWFRRKRYPQDGHVPKAQVFSIFAHIQSWAYETFERDGKTNSSLLVLSEQAKRIKEILEALPEQQLTMLETERIVRTIYEPTPFVVQAEEQGRYHRVPHPGAAIQSMPDLIWWNFIQQEPVHFFSRWYVQERKYLEQQGVRTETPDEENTRRLRMRRLPIARTSKRLLLFVPDSRQGESAIAHPLTGELEAIFGDLTPIRIEAEQEKSIPGFPGVVPAYCQLAPRPLPQPQAFINVSKKDWIKDRKKESYTSLESLLYYPYQWVFRYQLRLRKSSILSVVPDETLMGKLAHRLFEKLFEEFHINWTREQLDQWIETTFPDLLAREGAVLLLYGREPERISFLRRIKFAAWSLVSAIQANNWEVEASEEELEREIGDSSIRGFADLILKRGPEKAILDLKWRGLRRRSEMIRNEEDLQLNLYSLLLTGDPGGAHTAYFIIRDGRFVARTNEAFAEVQPVQGDADRREVCQRIHQRMVATWEWRKGQLQKGWIEVRCTETVDELEDTYADEGVDWQDILEMRSESAYYDDYRTLIGL